jgi:hypothetical protein
VSRRPRRGSAWVAVAALTVAAAAATGTTSDFETPAAEQASSSLPAELASGVNFHVTEPVEVDGLMHHYVLDSHFGLFPAYGRAALAIRVREVAALTQISKTTDIDVVVKSVSRRVQGDAKSLAQVAVNPVKTVVGIPQGISHLFNGYKAQGSELMEHAQKSVAPGSVSNVPRDVKADATRYAERYLGVSAAERRYYQELGVDPYSNNEVLRKAIHHLAKVDATVNLGMRFVGIPGVPYLGDVKRAMEAIYHEDPAVLRARQRKTLAGYGLDPAEVKRFENTLLLSPTRQTLLLENAKSLEGASGRDELFRHALSLTSEEEVEVFLQSTGLLVRLHAHRPVLRILAGLRLPTAQLADGKIAVLGSFDAVYWTEDVAGYETALHAALHAALPPDSGGLELWLSGTVSPRARDELTARDWEVHDNAVASLGGAGAATAIATAPAHSAPLNSFAIRDVRVFDGEKTREHATVVIEDGRITAFGSDAAIPAGMPVIDGHGKTVLPGLIDSHVHVFPGAQQDALRFGVTTELDIPRARGHLEKWLPHRSHAAKGVTHDSIRCSPPHRRAVPRQGNFRNPGSPAPGEPAGH